MMVSIIVPSYNHCSFLKQRLDSIFNQSYQNFEVILLDDASTDGSQKLLKDYESHPKVSHLRFNDHNTGNPFSQWQKGIGLAQGEFVWIAESDDYCEPSFLERLLPKFKSDTAIVQCASIIINNQDRSFGIDKSAYRLDKTRWTLDYENLGSNEIKEYLRFQNTIPNASAVVFRRDLAIESIIPSNLLFCGDWYFWIELLKKGNIYFCSQPLNYFRKHPNSTRQTKNIKKEQRRISDFFSIITNNSTQVDRIKNRVKYEWVMKYLLKVSNHITFKEIIGVKLRLMFRTDFLIKLAFQKLRKKI